MADDPRQQQRRRLRAAQVTGLGILLLLIGFVLLMAAIDPFSTFKHWINWLVTIHSKLPGICVLAFGGALVVVGGSMSFAARRR